MRMAPGTGEHQTGRATPRRGCSQTQPAALAEKRQPFAWVSELRRFSHPNEMGCSVLDESGFGFGLVWPAMMDQLGMR